MGLAVLETEMSRGAPLCRDDGSASAPNSAEHRPSSMILTTNQRVYFHHVLHITPTRARIRHFESHAGTVIGQNVGKRVPMSLSLSHGGHATPVGGILMAGGTCCTSFTCSIDGITGSRALQFCFMLSFLNIPLSLTPLFSLHCPPVQ